MKSNLKLKRFSAVFLIFLLIVFISGFVFGSTRSQAIKGKNELSNLRTSSVNFTNATVISDGFGGTYWNDGSSYDARIAVEGNGKIHVVWEDATDGPWGTDYEIMYVRYTPSTGWSNITIVSDGYGGTYWNNADSFDAAVAVDTLGKVHVVWEDNTDGPWGTDVEIMHAVYSSSTGWSNATVISDGYSGTYWNNGASNNPAIATDKSGKVHVVWEDGTDGAWGTDVEIMYAVYSSSTGWSNATVISDGYGGIYWNNAGSNDAAIAIDSLGNVHVVWEDGTDGAWGTDFEIMHAVYSPSTGWSDVTVISDGHNGIYWNSGPSYDPAICIGSGNSVHVVWEDSLAGAAWGGDTEIMYSSYSQSTGWILPRVVSDGFNGTYWNIGVSVDADITIDANGAIHILWEDYTSGPWGTDYEIMHASYTPSQGWSNVTIISDGYGGSYWNNGDSRYVAAEYGNGKVHVVWSDTTDGIWGTDYEIMYSSIPITVTSQPAAIPFGNYYLIFTIVGIIGVIILMKRKTNI